MEIGKEKEKETMIPRIDGSGIGYVMWLSKRQEGQGDGEARSGHMLLRGLDQLCQPLIYVRSLALPMIAVLMLRRACRVALHIEIFGVDEKTNSTADALACALVDRQQ